MLSERQLAVRRTGIGSSDAAAVVQRSPFTNATPWRVYMSKVAPEQLPPMANQDALRAGNFLEDGAARMYAAELGGGIRLHREGRTRRHPKERWMLATPDRYVVIDGKRVRGLEVKTVGPEYSDLWGHDEQAIPEHVFIQVQWQMEVTGLPVVDVVALFMVSRELRIYRIPRHERTIAALRTLCSRFWTQHVVALTPPPIDGSSACTAGLGTQYPGPVSELVAAPLEAEDHARAYVAARDAQAAAKKELALHGNHLRGMIGDVAGIQAPWGHSTWKPDSKGRVDYKALSAHLLKDVDPKMVERITEQHRGTPGRVLRVNVKDDRKEEAA